MCVRTFVYVEREDLCVCMCVLCEDLCVCVCVCEDLCVCVWVCVCV